MLVFEPGQDEEQVGETVHVADSNRGDRLVARKLDDLSLRPTAYGSGVVEECATL